MQTINIINKQIMPENSKSNSPKTIVAYNNFRRDFSGHPY